MTAPAQARWEAIGTSVHLMVTDRSVLAAATALARAFLSELDLACSRFRPDSELSALGRTSGPRTVSPVLAAALQAACDVAALTDGLVDPTVGGDLVALGYDRTFRELPADGPTDVSLPLPPRDWRSIHVQDDQVTMPEGMHLDLGATAKAWASDAIAAQLAEVAPGAGVLVNLGGDIAVSGAAPAGGWPVGVADRPGGTAHATVALETGGLATSSTTARTWRREGVLHHHIVDPRTRRPAEPVWAATTVAAPTCLEANAASTAAVVLGSGARSWLEARGYPACLLSSDGEVVRLNGWPS